MFWERHKTQFITAVFLLLLPNEVIVHERSLVFTNGGVIKFIIGLSTPLDLPVSVNWLQNVQFQYNPVDNTTQLNYLNLLRSGQQSISRTKLYRLLENSLKTFGENGTACILQTICEFGTSSLAHNGIWGEILNAVFTPKHDAEDVYHEAFKYGKETGICEGKFGECKRSFFKSFTRLT